MSDLVTYEQDGFVFTLKLNRPELRNAISDVMLLGLVLAFGMKASYAQQTRSSSNYPDFAPIALIATAPYMLVVNPSVPVRSIKELIALGSPDFQRWLREQGFEPAAGNPEHFARHLKTEIDKWSKVVKISGAHPE